MRRVLVLGGGSLGLAAATMAALKAEGVEVLDDQELRMSLEPGPLPPDWPEVRPALTACQAGPGPAMHGPQRNRKKGKSRRW